MNSGSSFEYGRKLAIRLVIAASVCCVISLLCPEGSYYQFGFVALTAAIFVGTIICVYQFCRCPYCGKHIMLSRARRQGLPALPQESGYRQEDQEEKMIRHG